MKITMPHYNHLARSIQPAIDATPLQAYRDAGLSDKRYRWDMTYKAGLSGWICDELYPYLNDDHIDTALRSITNTK